MSSHDATTLVHLIGFMAGIVLYALLGVMTLRSLAAASPSSEGLRSDRIPLATAVLGLVWNAGAMVSYSLRDFGVAVAPVPLTLMAFSALGFLPAVVVHSSLQGADGRTRVRPLVGAAYLLSAVAAVVQLLAAIGGDPLPSRAALLTLTIGYGCIIGLMTLHTRRQHGARRALAAVALAAFAVMALHLSQHTAASDSWPVEIVGHHASIPLALVILYQDYRFALADIFLKRAVTLLVTVAVAVLLYTTVAVPWILPAMHGDFTQPMAVGGLIALWVITAMAYPVLRGAVGRFVDRVVLRRTNFRELRAAVASRIAAEDAADRILDAACDMLRPALSAEQVTWRPIDEPNHSEMRPQATRLRAGGLEATLVVPTTERPNYEIQLGRLGGGRRLLSDDQELLESVALLVARRIDAVRTVHERYDRDLREREMSQLATEAELRALRAQLNPHFLFNTLTTIGHLMQEAPGRALDTLYQLTGLLRAVLTRSQGAFTTLGEELEIVGAYLAIECARFEERLAVSIDVPPRLLTLRIPPLLLQPLAENAVKHGITPQRTGGQVIIAAHLEGVDAIATSAGSGRLRLSVRDTGVGTTAAELRRRRTTGIGLHNIERRLERYFGAAASLDVRSALGHGTTVEVVVPVELADLSHPMPVRAGVA